MSNVKKTHIATSNILSSVQKSNKAQTKQIQRTRQAIRAPRHLAKRCHLPPGAARAVNGCSNGQGRGRATPSAAVCNNAVGELCQCVERSAPPHSLDLGGG